MYVQPVPVCPVPDHVGHFNILNFIVFLELSILLNVMGLFPTFLVL